MRKRSKTVLFTTITAGIILFVEILIGQFFPRLTFINSSLTTANRIAGYFAFSFFLFSLLLSFKVNRFVTVPLGVVLFSFFFVNSCSEIYPIDTTTNPVDIAVLRKDENGNKLIAREYKNAKTNEMIQDTVLVKDYLIFRKIIDNKTNPHATNR